MEEKNFLDENGVVVTNTRFIVSSQTYAMSGITSVKNSYQPPSRFFPVVLLLVGLLCLVGAPAVGVILIVVAVLWLIGQKTDYHVLLTTASGEAKALSSNNKEFIAKVVQALNDAIVARG